MPKKRLSAIRKKPGGSNAGKYKEVPKGEFAGPSGGAPAGTYPINTKKRAKAALSYAHNAPDPEGIKKKVKKEYPSLGKPKAPPVKKPKKMPKEKMPKMTKMKKPLSKKPKMK
jgi:hypothetical protein